MKQLTIAIPFATYSEEWERDFTPTEDAIRATKGDLLTFWQRFPDTTPHHSFYFEWESVAVLDTSSYANWWLRVGTETRAMVRKARKLGVVVMQVRPDREFCKGVSAIYNESPTRLGKPFRMYGRTPEDVEALFGQENALGHDYYLGAYYQDQLVGFAHVERVDNYAWLSSLQGFMRHFDKALMNALISGVVELCSQLSVPYLIYGYMQAKHTGIGAFKRHNGFIGQQVPRYYLPLTMRGRIALLLHLHHGWSGLLPSRLKRLVKRLL